ncbi:Serine/threonine protein phosphatase PrpC [Lachnospiraceae bacterium]|nr:Serine/threonine protein phosphatase PrpC [Lachnospiraceae bacterium]
MKIRIAALSDVGTVREINQDSVLIKTDTAHSYGKVVFAMLCDGMGGLSGGEIASATMVRRFEKWFEEEMPKELSAEDTTEQLDGSGNIVGKLRSVRNSWLCMAEEVNRLLLKYGEEKHIKIGTTAVALLIVNEEYILMNVGDSRIYGINGGRTRQLTRDQSYIQRMIDLGRLTRHEAEQSHRDNLLLQCIGVNEELSPEFEQGCVSTDTAFVLCSDGFWKKLTPEEIGEAIWKGMDSESLLKEEIRDLINKVKTRKEHDNISAAAVACCI